MQALSQDETLAGSEYVIDSVQEQSNEAGAVLSSPEESKAGANSAASDFTFQFKSSLVIQSQEIKEKNSPIEEEKSVSSDSDNQRMSQGDDT